MLCSYHISFCMPASGIDLVQLSHFILHACVWHAYCTAITPHFACLCLACILCSYHTSFCMPACGMHIVQLSHLILHACVWHAYCAAITLRFECLFCPPRHTLAGPSSLLRCPSPIGPSALECQHCVCTHAAEHKSFPLTASSHLVSESGGWGESLHLGCILYSYHTSLCVPNFQIHHTSSGPSSPPCICSCVLT